MIETVIDFLKQVSEQIVLPYYRSLSECDVHEKAPGQLVTTADIETEAWLTSRLRELLPDAAVVGEEGAAAAPDLPRLLEQSGPVWVVDPIDGTRNFARGRRHFAIMVALVRDRETVAGWIHDPLSGRTATAERGGGTWIGGQRATLAPVDALVDMTGSVGSWRAAHLAPAVAGFDRCRSAAHDYLALIEGRIQFAHFRRLLPWDHAAGVLLHAEAGGYGRLFDGQRYLPRPGSQDLLLAPDAASWSQLKALLQPD